MIEEIKNSDFTDVLKSKLAVVDFSAVWCGPCQMLAPIMEELSDEMDGEVDFFSAVILIKRKGLQERQLISFCLTHLLHSWQALSLFRLALHSVFNPTQVLHFFSLLFRIYLTV